MIVKTIETMFWAMSDAERLATVAMITEVCKELGHAYAESSTTPKKSGWKREATWCVVQTYWMRNCQGYRHVQEGYVSDRR